MDLPEFVDFKKDHTITTAFAIVLCPVLNNAIARLEYRFRMLNRLCLDPRRAIRLFAGISVMIAILRDYLFVKMVRNQPQWPILYSNSILWFGYCCLLAGLTIVFNAFKAQGFYSFFMGEYFGIFLNKRPTSFPFNLLNHPVYMANVLGYFGLSLVFASQAGLVYTVFACGVLSIAGYFENSFFNDVYDTMSVAYHQKL